MTKSLIRRRTLGSAFLDRSSSNIFTKFSSICSNNLSSAIASHHYFSSPSIPFHRPSAIAAEAIRSFLIPSRFSRRCAVCRIPKPSVERNN
ncbi:unnamed protein product [Linum tenue]|uniref:Uncharacterized protein n=1 Tax=Linum tenue TaxID=586396 RepID=A0AAV0RM35_9ROSI|nr:unnamed protein product [Linum tenue]CAI0558341.1 unnamed protein product [Linum tenue]